jgi:hypothetical protein
MFLLLVEEHLIQPSAPTAQNEQAQTDETRKKEAYGNP